MFATAGSEEKVKLCRELGADVAINYREHGLRARSCSPRPASRGVDVVFDNVGEAVMDKSMKCIAYNGRYLMMGFASDKTRVDEKLIVPRRRRGRELQAVRRAARLRAGRPWRRC